MSAVPTIDFARAATDAGELARLDAACADHGFFLLANHGLDAEIEAMWEQSAAFFAAPMAQKRRVARSADSPLGYYDRELTKRKRDQKEVFDFSPPRNPDQDINRWPADRPAFKACLLEFTAAAGNLAAEVLELVYRALTENTAGLPRGNHRRSNIRLNYYPVSDPLTAGERAAVTALGDMALHHHTDPGILTLLVQDGVGGLQTESRSSGWIDVPPVPGTIVVNLGDAMQVWTNDRYRAAVHRVLPMGGRARYSTPYFYNPQPDAVLEPLPPLMAGAEPEFRSFTWREFIQARIDDNYADLGADDTQIDNFRIRA
ncbi:MAG: 2OG-Fe(II) oxygenase family protein [Pseudomonadota bacterium]